MKTSKELIYNALNIMNQGKSMPVEEALVIAATETGLAVLDNIKIIRDFLVNKRLLRFNPRVTFVGVREYIKNGVSFVYDEIHEDYINDHLTQDCIDLINTNLLHSFIYETNKRKKIFLYVGHSNWGKSHVLRHITDDNSKRKIKLLFERVFRVRKMSNDDDELKLLEFVSTISKSSYNYYLIAFCPRQLRSERTRNILSILKESGDLFFLVQKHKFNDNSEVITTEEYEDLRNYGIVEVINENIEYTERSNYFLKFISGLLETTEN